jgi:hypothetical protein
MADLLTGLEPEPPAHCDWCLTFSGRTKKGRKCCELRELASMPKEQRQAVYNAVWTDQGFEAAGALKAAVVGEYKRRLAALKIA